MGIEYHITFEFEAQFTTRATIPLFALETEGLTIEEAKGMLDDPAGRELATKRIWKREARLADEEIDLRVLEEAVKAIELNKARVTEVKSINLEAGDTGELIFESVEQMIEETESYGHFLETCLKTPIPSDQLEIYIDSFKAYAKKLEKECGKDLREALKLTPEEEEEARKKQKVKKMMNDAVGGEGS